MSDTDTTPREINTVQVRQAISAALYDVVSDQQEGIEAAGRIFVILDRASAGLPLDGAR